MMHNFLVDIATAISSPNFSSATYYLEKNDDFHTYVGVTRLSDPQHFRVDLHIPFITSQGVEDWSIGKQYVVTGENVVNVLMHDAYLGQAIQSYFRLSKKRNRNR